MVRQGPAAGHLLIDLLHGAARVAARAHDPVTQPVADHAAVPELLAEAVLAVCADGFVVCREANVGWQRRGKADVRHGDEGVLAARCADAERVQLLHKLLRMHRDDLGAAVTARDRQSSRGLYIRPRKQTAETVPQYMHTRRHSFRHGI